MTNRFPYSPEQVSNSTSSSGTPPKRIETLVEDIYNLFKHPRPFSHDNIQAFVEGLVRRISEKLAEERGAPTLRLSNLGTPCDRKLWYSINQPEKGELLPPPARIKFLFGDILEELLLFLSREAGHKVEGEQDEIVVEGIVGHRDGTIDGVLVDCKSASSRSFDKFANHLVQDNDAFGYLVQLDSYAEGSNDIPLQHKDEAAFLVIDKQLGKIVLDKQKRLGINYKELVSQKRKMLGEPSPPPRPYVDEADGKSGNRKLPVVCSYCQFKKTCWPGLRTFLYSNGPRYLTKVVRLPDVPESNA